MLRKSGIVGLVGLVMFLNGTNMKVSGVRLISAFSNWINQVRIGMCMRCTRSAWHRMSAKCVFSQHKPNTRNPNTSAHHFDRQTRIDCLTVNGNKFAKDSNSSKWHLEMHSAVHTQRHDNPLAPMFNVGVCARQLVLRNLRCSLTLAFCAVVRINIEREGMGGSWLELLRENLRE